MPLTPGGDDPDDAAGAKDPKPKKSQRKPRPHGLAHVKSITDQRHADPRSSALSMLATYLLGRTHALNADLEAAWPAEKGAKGISFGQFLHGLRNVPPDSFNRLRDEIIASMRRLVAPNVLAMDLAYLAPLFRLVGIPEDFNYEVENAKPSDAEYVHALGLDPVDFDLGRGQRLSRDVGGFWLGLRLSTQEEILAAPGLHYNAFILTVHDLSYLYTDERGKERQIHTTAPHFSLRTRPRNDDKPIVTYRGHVLEFRDEEVTLLGASEDKKKLVRITIRHPVETHLNSKLVSYAHGIITITNSGGATISGPVACGKLPLPAEITRLRSDGHVEDRERERLLSQKFLEERRRLERFAKSYAGDALENDLGHLHSNELIRQLRHVIGKAVSDVQGGSMGHNYYVSQAEWLADPENEG